MVTDSERSDPTRESSVLLRGLAILGCFDSPMPVITASAIVKQTGLPPATVHRILTILIEGGAVERVSRGSYRLGLKMWRLGSSVPQARVLRDVALPFLEDLYETTHEVVHLAVRDGLETLYIEKISGRGAVSVTSRVGRRLPLHATGPGKVLLAYGPRDVFDQLVARGLPALTPQTITDPDAIRRSIAEIRRSGYALSREESSVGTASVAAPIFGSLREIIASVSVVVPASTFNPWTLAPVVRAVALGISRGMGAPSR
ncbi:IclR family transcriptional regulator [Sinomonas terrae]|uniref:IclR family transcriptional regulator n=1 Tax=Sinomonas terrae TaxID=2908838 RepID=A0ABS9TW52_9MICC|nr:IclR family transcriptional regulator [Sinomonas terrae]MCH6468648.1 IclR family transcriptional regulator [Sinomonas terrae]